MWNSLVASPGDDILLGGTDGGKLLLGPPGIAPGAMRLDTMQNRIWFLLREPGPLTGYPATGTGSSVDFPQSMLTQDLNLALPEFLSQTGIAPGLIERQDVLPVFPVLDYPVPPGCQSVIRIEYTPYGLPTYVLDGKSFDEFDSYTGGWISNVTGGQPSIYREPFAGYVRLQPQPGPGNALGVGLGTITFSGTATAGEFVMVTLANPATGVTVIVPAYTVPVGATLATIATDVSNLINNSNACIGPNPFLSPTTATNESIQLNGLTAPGTQITYAVSVTGALVVSPTGVNSLTPTGDTMTWYYTAAGDILALPGDTPSMPPQFHMALVYRVLGDYWEVKQDPSQADRYMKKFEMMVARGKTYTYDSNRATQPTMAGEDVENYGWAAGEFY